MSTTRAVTPNSSLSRSANPVDAEPVRAREIRTMPDSRASVSRREMVERDTPMVAAIDSIVSSAP